MRGRCSSRGYEILYLDHPIDETVLQQLRMYEGKGFVNILTEDLGFQTDEEKKAAEEKVVENKELLDFIRDSIGDEKLKQVTLSSKLVSSACCLTSTGGFTLEMEKYFRNGPSEEMRKLRADRVLELNGKHAACLAIKKAYDDGDKGQGCRPVQDTVRTVRADRRRRDRRPHRLRRPRLQSF